MLMAAVAYNLKKLMKWQQQKRKTAVMRMKKAEKSLCFLFFKLCGSIQLHNYLQVNFAKKKLKKEILKTVEHQSPHV